MLVADPGRQRQPPRCVNAAAPRGEHAQAPVADLVAEALHDHRLVGGHDPGRVLLLAQVGDQVRCRAPIEVVLVGELHGIGAHRLAREGADRPTELRRAADPVPLPEGHRARNARRRRDDHAVAGDLLDPPGGGAEQEGLARPRLVDHLLVELADAAAVGQVDGEQPAVGDRAGVGDRERARALPRADRPRDAIPHEARAKVGETV